MTLDYKKNRSTPPPAVAILRYEGSRSPIRGAIGRWQNAQSRVVIYESNLDPFDLLRLLISVAEARLFKNGTGQAFTNSPRLRRG